MEIKHIQEALAFDRMLTLMEMVREQCPWDSSQTNDSLRTLTIEELYELSQAILDKKDEEICKELGDVLMHVVFYALIGKERGVFDITKVLDSLSEKLIRRHPHVFDKQSGMNAEQVEKNWEQIKLQEGNKSTFAGVPATLPSLIKAYRLQGKAKGIGFDIHGKDDVFDTVIERLKRLHTTSNKQDEHGKTQEFGDILFSLIDYARLMDINPDTALEKSNKKFKSRLEYMEDMARQSGKALYGMNEEEMKALWQEAGK